ncbi:MAG: FxLYD domain-containing protein [Anaerolineales bacterium]
MRTCFALLSVLGLTCAVAACASSQPQPASTPTPAQTPAPVPRLPSPTPTLQASVEGLYLIPGTPPTSSTAMGYLLNRTDSTVEDVTLRVSLVNDQGGELAQSVIDLAVPLLGPGQSAPFSAAFPTSQDAEIQIEITGYRPASDPPAPIDVNLNRRTLTDEGKLAVVGIMHNPNPTPVEILGLAMAATDSQGRLVGVGSDWRGLSGLAAGKSVPFLALLPANETTVHVRAFVSAIATDELPPSPIEWGASPKLLTDDQGNPLVLASIRNSGSTPALARVLVTLEGSSGTASAAVYASPIPLAPDETRPFSVTDFPGLASQLASGGQSLSDLRARGQVDPSRSEATSQASVPLNIEVTAYENIGGALLVHGTAYNQSQDHVLQPIVIGALRSTSGMIWSAGEATIAENLEPGAQTDFLLVMPKPANIEPSQGEFDIRGLGLAP